MMDDYNEGHKFTIYFAMFVLKLICFIWYIVAVSDIRCVYKDSVLNFSLNNLTFNNIVKVIFLFSLF